MKEITVDAVLENMPVAAAFVEEQMEAFACPLKPQMQIQIAIDEILGNIVHYAYDATVGKVTIGVKTVENPRAVILSFTDSGKPYNPLTLATPETSLTAEERELGGLGIHMVKCIMDDVSYEYRDGKNILTIKKEI